MTTFTLIFLLLLTTNKGKMDLVSASADKLELLPSQGDEVESEELQEWVEDMKERADRLGILY